MVLYGFSKRNSNGNIIASDISKVEDYGTKKSPCCPSPCTTYSRNQQTCRKARHPCLGQSEAQGDSSNLRTFMGPWQSFRKNHLWISQGLAPEIVPSIFAE